MQLQMMWRVSPEPVITLDGDTAGQRAAMRVIDLSLPLLEAGQSVRFAMMPDGQDPDDLLKSGGAGAMREKIEGALPMVQLLWDREVEGKNFDSPERKAALDKSLREKIMLIKDPSIRSHYGQAIKDMRWELFGNKSRAFDPSAPRTKWLPKGAKLPAQSSTKASMLAGSHGSEDHLREAVILAVLIRNPKILKDFYSALERMLCSGSDNAALRDALLQIKETDDVHASLVEVMGEGALEKLFTQPHVAITPAVSRPDNGDHARMTLAEELAKLTARRGHAHEVADAMSELSSDVADERLTTRLAQSIAAMNNAGRQDSDDSAEYHTGGNGARIKKDERSAFDALLDNIDFAKGGKSH
jgi:DNA primase